MHGTCITRTMEGKTVSSQEEHRRNVNPGNACAHRYVRCDSGSEECPAYTYRALIFIDADSFGSLEAYGPCTTQESLRGHQLHEGFAHQNCAAVSATIPCATGGAATDVAVAVQADID